MERADFYNVFLRDTYGCGEEAEAYLHLHLEDIKQVRHAFDGYLFCKLDRAKMNLVGVGGRLGADPPGTWRDIWTAELWEWGLENPQSFRRAWRAYRYDLKKRLEVDDWDFSHQSDAEIGLRYFRAMVKVLAGGDLSKDELRDHWKNAGILAPSYSAGIRSEMEDLERYYPTVSYPWPPVLSPVERMAKIVENRFIPKLLFHRIINYWGLPKIDENE